MSSELGDFIKRNFRFLIELRKKLNIEIIEVDHLAVIELARDTGLTTYDASYHWLASQLQGEWVTLDAKMQRAVKGN